MTTASNDLPADVRRSWGDALAAAGLYGEALRLWPDDLGDTLRRAELAILAEEAATALHVLDGAGDGVPRAEADVLAACARAIGGEDSVLPMLVEAASRAQVTPAMHALIAIALADGNLRTAGRSAAQALAGGREDWRLTGIAAAAEALDGRFAEALTFLAGSGNRSGTDEDPATYALYLLARVGADRAAGGLSTRHKRRSVVRRFRERRAELPDPNPDMGCRCRTAGTMRGTRVRFYVERHLNELPDAPPAGLPGRMLRCPETGVVFLDRPERLLTVYLPSPNDVGTAAANADGTDAGEQLSR